MGLSYICEKKGERHVAVSPFCISNKKESGLVQLANSPLSGLWIAPEEAARHGILPMLFL
jgi:hypothetical protein